VCVIFRAEKKKAKFMAKKKFRKSKERERENKERKKKVKGLLAWYGK